MIGITGNMSGGKTYTAVEILLSKLCSSHIVATNIKLNCNGVTSYLHCPCVIWKQFYYLLENDDEFTGNYHCIALHDYNNYPCGSSRGSDDYEKRKVFIFLDEISSVFDSMISSADGGIQSVAAWVRHSEKRGQMIYLIMQFASELHKRLRNHITEYIHCTNSNNILIPFTGLHLPSFLRNKIIRTHYMADGETLVGQNHWFNLDPQVYKCYNTGQIVVGHKTEDIMPIQISIDRSDFIFSCYKKGVYVLCLILLLSFSFSLLFLL